MQFSRLYLLPISCFMLLLLGSLIMGFEMFFFVIAPIVGLTFLAVGSWFIVFWWFKRIPYAARQLERAARLKRPPAIIVHDSGRAAITTIQERLGEGIVVTDEGKYKILPQFTALEGNPKKYQKEYRDFVSKRATLIGLEGLPIWFGYSGKICLLNPEALALYEAGEMMIETGGKPMFNPNKKRGKKIRDALKPLMLIDPKKAKDLVNPQFDVTQIGAIITESENIGRLGISLGKYAVPIAILMMVVVGAILFLLLGPSFIQQLTPQGAGV